MWQQCYILPLKLVSFTWIFHNRNIFHFFYFQKADSSWCIRKLYIFTVLNSYVIKLKKTVLFLFYRHQRWSFGVWCDRCNKTSFWYLGRHSQWSQSYGFDRNFGLYSSFSSDLIGKLWSFMIVLSGPSSSSIENISCYDQW